jgi:hypothetical protein
MVASIEPQKYKKNKGPPKQVATAWRSLADINKKSRPYFLASGRLFSN